MPQERLALYHFVGCPWCERVWAAIDDLGLEVEPRNVRREPAHAAALQAAVGRGTVPVLHIETGSEVQWLPESADIVTHLYARYGKGRSPTLLAGNTLSTVAIAAAAVSFAAGIALPDARSYLWVAAAFLFALRHNAILLRRLRPSRR